MKKEWLEEVVKSFRNLRIGVIGDMMIDDYLIGSVDRISPDAPVPIVSIKNERFSLGGAASVVNNLRNLGANILCFGVIGRDFNGNRLLKKLQKKGVDTSGIIDVDDRPTIVKKRVISSNYQLLRLDWENSNYIRTSTENILFEKIKNSIQSLNAVILSDYGKGLLTPRITKQIIELCKKNNIIVTVDSKSGNIENYYGATSMILNKKEAFECLGLNSMDNINRVGEKLKIKLGLNHLLLTKDEDGIILFKSNEIINMPTYVNECFDPTGVREAVISLYTLGLASGLKSKIAAKIANVVVGIVVGKIGTSVVTVDEILEFYNKIYKEEY